MFCACSSFPLTELDPTISSTSLDVLQSAAHFSECNAYGRREDMIIRSKLAARLTGVDLKCGDSSLPVLEGNRIHDLDVIHFSIGPRDGTFRDLMSPFEC